MDVAVVVRTAEFDGWRFDPHGRSLSRRDASGLWTPVPIGSRAAEILALLLEHPGALVTKDAIMARVWPGVVVEANNVTVQIATLRKILDEGRSGDSLIQTVPGRGYRFVGQVAPAAEPEETETVSTIDSPVAPPPVEFSTPAMSARWRASPRWRGIVWAIVVLMASLLGLAWRAGWLADPLAPPLTVAVLPFETPGGRPDEARLADNLSRILTDGLSGASLITVAATGAARRGVEQDADMRGVGRKLGVRYVVSGELRADGDVARVKLRLVSIDTNALVWADSVEVPMVAPNGDVSVAMIRLFAATYPELIAAEAARVARERPDRPTATDLLLRGQSLALQPPNPARSAEMSALFEHAVTLDPSSDIARSYLVDQLLDDEDFNPRGRKVAYDRASALMSGLRAGPGKSWSTASVNLHWLSWQMSRCSETIAAGRQVIARYPWMTQAYRWLGDCLSRTGHADEAVGVLNEAVRLGQDSPFQSRNYRNLQNALLLVGRYDESIAWGERALALNPRDARWLRAQLLRRLAAANALSGRLDTARSQLAESVRLVPYVTLRAISAGAAADAVYAAQIDRVRDGLRLAGLRDHADEAADFGTPADDVIHQEDEGPTPRTAPGVATITTDNLIGFLDQQKPVLIDTTWNRDRRSVPGAIGLRYVGDGGNLSDAAQDRLRAKMREITKGDLTMPVVAIGWNSESFGGRNLALRLVALGYTRVSWYRGGREAWEARGLPEADLVEQDW
jgi:DNA-binding winged helix-turn-helix (wHTH) protein/TolB-like protein/tetratricopeptide (TPR) repeat protein